MEILQIHVVSPRLAISVGELLYVILGPMQYSVSSFVPFLIGNQVKIRDRKVRWDKKGDKDLISEVLLTNELKMNALEVFRYAQVK